MGRRWIWVVGIVLIALVIGGLLWRNHLIGRDIEAWEDYRRSSEAAGEPLDIESWLPPVIPDDRNFAAHPWIQGLVHDPDGPEAQFVARFSHPDLFDGEEYEPAGTTSWFDTRPLLAAAVMELAAEHRADFEAIIEASKRPACRFPFSDDPAVFWKDHSRIVQQFGEFPDILTMTADAALVSGEPDTAVELIAAAFRIGDHVRAQHSLLSLIVGVGIESRASAVVGRALDRGILDADQRKFILAAMRTRPASADLAGAWRVERGVMLAMFQQIENDARNLPHEWRYPAEWIEARSSLYICRALEHPLRDPAWRVRWEHFSTWLDRHPHEHPTLAPGAAALFVGGRIAGGIFAAEDRLDTLRARLAP